MADRTDSANLTRGTVRQSKRRIIAIIALNVAKILATILITTSIVYFGLRLVSGNPEAARRGIVAQEQGEEQPNKQGEEQSEERQITERTDKEQGFLTLLRGYPRWAARTLTFRFLPSYYSNLHPGALILARIGPTALLALAAFALSLLLAISCTVVRARYPRVFNGTLLRIASQFIITIPEFWLALLLLFCFAIALPLFPLFGAESARHYVLPLLALAITRGAVLFLLLDAAMERERHAEYVLSARLRRVAGWRIATHYQLRNALLVLIPIATIQFGYLFGGAVIIEQVFGISGFGTLLLQSLQRRDYPVAEACIYVVACVFSILGVVGDVARRLTSVRESIIE